MNHLTGIDGGSCVGSSQDQCLPGFTHVPGTSSCYMMSENRVTWRQANDACRAKGHAVGLVAMETDQEHQALETYLRSARSRRDF